MTEPHGGTEKNVDKRTVERSQRDGDTPRQRNGDGNKLEAVELDHNLIRRVQRLTTGATVHRFSQALTVYIGNAELWNRFVAQEPASSGEVEEKMILRDRALAMQVQLRQEILKEELRSIQTCSGQFS